VIIAIHDDRSYSLNTNVLSFRLIQLTDETGVFSTNPRKKFAKSAETFVPDVTQYDLNHSLQLQHPLQRLIVGKKSAAISIQTKSKGYMFCGIF
jgi:hypothetical protein